jgi:MFS family permease
MRPRPVIGAGVRRHDLRLVRFLGWLVLLNAAPALGSLLLFSHDTERGFAWTLKPLESVRLLTGLYVTAVTIGVLALRAKSATSDRSIAVLATTFAVGATTVSLLHANLLLAHPWWHATQWFGVYGILIPLGIVAIVRLGGNGGGPDYAHRVGPDEGAAHATLGDVRVFVILAGVLCAALAAPLTLAPGSAFVRNQWPWTVPPLSARMAGVWAASLAVALGWTAAHPDRWFRQAAFGLVAVLGVTLLVAPSLGEGTRSFGDVVGSCPVYVAIACGLVVSGLGGVIGSRTTREPSSRR